MGDHLSLKPLRLARSGKVEPMVPVRGYAGERPVHAAPVDKIRIRNRAIVEVGNLLEQRNQLMAVVKWQRIEQNSIHYGENGGVQSNAQGKRDNGNRGKAGRLLQHAKAVTQILKERFERRVRHTTLDSQSGGLVSRQPADVIVVFGPIYRSSQVVPGRKPRL